MQQTNQNLTTEIDLKDLLKILWSSKKLILLMMVLGLAVGMIFVDRHEPEFTSETAIKLVAHPPGLTPNDLQIDFGEMFLSRETFDAFEQVSKPKKLQFEMLQPTQFIDGIAFKKHSSLVVIKVKGSFERSTYTVSVLSNDLILLQEVTSYLDYISNKLTYEYLQTAKSDLAAIREAMDRWVNGHELLMEGLNWQRFVDKVKGGKPIFLIEAPSFPRQTNGLSLILFVIIVCSSGLLGCFFAVVAWLVRRSI